MLQVRGILGSGRDIFIDVHSCHPQALAISH